MSKYCPECGHEFKQGEWYYDYSSGNCYAECPECEWEGNYDEIQDDDDFDFDEFLNKLTEYLDN